MLLGVSTSAATDIYFCSPKPRPNPSPACGFPNRRLRQRLACGILDAWIRQAHTTSACQRNPNCILCFLLLFLLSFYQTSFPLCSQRYLPCPYRVPTYVQRVRGHRLPARQQLYAISRQKSNDRKKDPKSHTNDREKQEQTSQGKQISWSENSFSHLGDDSASTLTNLRFRR